MNTRRVFRALGIVFAIGGVALLVGLWMTNNQDYSFIHRPTRIDVRQTISFLLSLSVLHYVLAVIAVLALGLAVSISSSAYLYRRRFSGGRVAK